MLWEHEIAGSNPATETKDKMEQRIVCAANRVNNHIICGVRHYDSIMHGMFNFIALSKYKTDAEVEQGFVDNSGKFLSRTEAWVVAEKANQIIRRVGGDTADGGTLYSENLY